MKPKHSAATAVAALILAIAGLAVSISVNSTDDGNGHKTKTYTLKVDRSGAAGVQTGTITVPVPVQAQIAPALETDLRNQTPAGMTKAQVDAAAKSAEGIKQTLPALPTGGATVEVPGCRTEFIHSYSSRNGVRPTIFTLHLTVSRNVPGWADVNAIVNLFAHEQASSNFVLDGEGHCAYIVPIEQKAWTQAGGNPFSVSVEVIDTGYETIYLAPAGMRQLRVIARWVNQQTGIPIRLGAVSSFCTPTRSGFVQHKDWGICGGGHVDISPFSVPSIVKYLAAGSKPSRKTVWIAHRKALHLQYVARCPRPKRGSVECSGLRARARVLDHLIAR